MELAEEFLKYIIRYVLDDCRDDLEFFNKRIDKTVLATLEHVAELRLRARHLHRGGRASSKKSGKTWEFPVDWGSDLQSEHERYPDRGEVQEAGDRHRLPAKRSKPFYMRDNDDGKTVRAMDVLVPRIGEIIGGSQREERLDVLAAADARRRTCDEERLLVVPRPAQIRHPRRTPASASASSAC